MTDDQSISTPDYGDFCIECGTAVDTSDAWTMQAPKVTVTEDGIEAVCADCVGEA